MLLAYLENVVLANAVLCTCANALKIDLDDQASLRKASKAIAENVQSYYHGTEVGGTPGIFGEPELVAWNESAIAWNALVDYWRLTGDDSYLDQTVQALSFQQGDNHDYQPSNRTASLVC